MTKEPPDEFAVVTKAPLVMPPDYNLRPPKPGAAPTNQYSPTESAAAAVYGEDPADHRRADDGRLQQGRKNSFSRIPARPSPITPSASRLAADAKSMEATNDDLTNKLLFQTGPDPQAGNPLDADAEKQRRIDTQRNPASTTAADQPADARGNDGRFRDDQQGQGFEQQQGQERLVRLAVLISSSGIVVMARRCEP